MQDASRSSRSVRVVRDHDDGFALISIQGLQEIENLVARFAIEIAHRFVAGSPAQGVIAGLSVYVVVAGPGVNDDPAG